MAELYLSQKNNRLEHEEVELFLEGYHDDLHVLQLKVMALYEQVSLVTQQKSVIKIPILLFNTPRI